MSESNSNIVVPSWIGKDGQPWSGGEWGKGQFDPDAFDPAATYIPKGQTKQLASNPERSLEDAFGGHGPK